jgi:hypothetical protein
MKCEITYFKKCKECNRTFIDNRWCGDITCQRCLDLCWVINDYDISERIFNCCDYHRPQISFNNMKITFEKTDITDDEQNVILADIEKRVKDLNSKNTIEYDDKEEDFQEENNEHSIVSSSPIVNAALKIRNISKTIFQIK